MIDADAFGGHDLSVAMTAETAAALAAHLDKGAHQEDLIFALWRPSPGNERYTAILTELIYPEDGDRILEGNCSFTPDYLLRVLERAGDCGIAFLHSHLGRGWQGMSRDDVIAEQERLASAVAGRTGLPLVGLTRGTDGAWSARFWLREYPMQFVRRWARTARVVGQDLAITYHPTMSPPPSVAASQVATASVWGDQRQGDLARVRVGVVGAGSVGSLVIEALARLGISTLTIVDFDHIEKRNLDRTAGAYASDVDRQLSKVQAAQRLFGATHTAPAAHVLAYEGSILDAGGLSRALDCDVLFSCVDRPWPRHMLNALAYAHLIPVVDGGIFALVDEGQLIHVDWRIHTVGPDHACMVCLGALSTEDVALDMGGKLDDPEYIKGLPPERRSALARQNVFPFSMSVAAHEVLQFIGLVTSMARVGGAGPQSYHGYPGEMEVLTRKECQNGCAYAGLTASAADLSGNLQRW